LTKASLIGQGRVAEIFDWEDGWVLKLFREWCPDAWVDYEARITRAVHAAGMAVPAVGDIVQVDGRRGIIYERVYGRPMTECFAAKPWTVLRLARLLGELHASMHGCVIPDLPPLRRHLEGKIQAAKPLPVELRKTALNAMNQLPEGDALCHGDFHPENVLVSPYRAVVIDWPDATRGHPLADVARTALILRVGGLPAGAIRRRLEQSFRTLFQRVYLRRYFQLRPNAREMLKAWQLPVAAGRLSEDIPEEREQVLAMVKALSTRWDDG
jgi:Ser/Thr protein kinase RdoA (MazF antagonist)